MVWLHWLFSCFKVLQKVRVRVNVFPLDLMVTQYQASRKIVKPQSSKFPLLSPSAQSGCWLRHQGIYMWSVWFVKWLILSNVPGWEYISLEEGLAACCRSCLPQNCSPGVFWFSGVSTDCTNPTALSSLAHVDWWTSSSVRWEVLIPSEMSEHPTA